MFQGLFPFPETKNNPHSEKKQINNRKVLQPIQKQKQNLFVEKPKESQYSAKKDSRKNNLPMNQRKNIKFIEKKVKENIANQNHIISQQIDLSLEQEKIYQDQEAMAQVQKHILMSSRKREYELSHKNIKIHEWFRSSQTYLTIMKQLLKYEIVEDIKKRFIEKQAEENQKQIKVKLRWDKGIQNKNAIQKLEIRAFSKQEQDDLEQSLAKQRVFVLLCKEFKGKLFQVQDLYLNEGCLLGFANKHRGKYYLNGIQKSCNIEQIKYLINMNSVISFVRQTHALQCISKSPLHYNILGNNLNLFEGDAKNKINKMKILSKPFFRQIENKLNLSQVTAIKDIFLQKKGIYLIQGPPGTGKSQTIANYILLQHQTLKNGQIIMACAQSNAAINNLAKKLIKNENCAQKITPKLLRLGHLDEYDEQILAISLPHLCEIKLQKLSGIFQSQYMSSAQLRRKQKLIQQKILLSKTQQSKDYRSLLDQRFLTVRKLNQINQFITMNRKQYNKIQQEFMEQAEIVFTTLSTSGKNKYSSFFYQKVKCLVIDEAAQATEISTLIPLQTDVQKMILVGDHKQLQPTIKSSNGKRTLFKRSLFERLVDAGKQPFMLNIQYRMLPELREFAGKTFYSNLLKDGKIPPKPHSLSALKKTSLFFNVCYGAEESQKTSYINMPEADCVISLVERISMYDENLTVGVIAPYKSQVNLIQKKISQTFVNKLKIKVSTVDSFQGQQMDVIIMTCVKANNNKQIGFVKDQKRLNVSITRAKYALFVFGHVSTLRSNDLWNEYIAHHQKNDAVVQIDNKNTYRYILKENTPFEKQSNFTVSSNN